MPAPRKSFKVADLLEFVNHNLASDKIEESVKDGLCSVVERVLMDTNNYKGFSYVDGYKGEETHKRFYMVASSLRDEYDALETQRATQGGMR